MDIPPTFVAELTKIYYNRMRIIILNNGIVFVTDIRDRSKWTKAFLEYRENTVLEDLGEDYVMDKVIHRMKEEGMDKFEMIKMLSTITGRMVDIDSYC